MTSPRLVASTGGVTLALHDMGGADGAPILLVLHATGFNGQMYEAVVAPLRNRYRIWAVDFRGHGASTIPSDGDFHWSGMADDVLNCIDELGGGPVDVFGHSMGAASAVAAAMRRPGAIRAGYLFEPIIRATGFGDPEGPNPMGAAARRRREIFPSRAEALDRYASRPPLNTLRADVLHAYVRYGFVDLPDGTVRLACRAESEARTFDAPGKLSVDDISDASGRFVIARGLRGSGPGPGTAAPAIAEALPDASLVDYELVGHFGPFEMPDMVASDVAALLHGDA